MHNSHEDIKRLIKASKSLLGKKSIQEEREIKKYYNILLEQEQGSGEEVYKKPNITQQVEDNIEKNTEEDEEEVEKNKTDKQQGYRISGGILYLHGKDRSDLELTTDEKIAFQETMDEFINEVSDLVDFKQMNVYQKNVEWGGNLINQNIDFIYSIGENNGVYIEGKMIKVDDEFVQTITKIRTYYEKFKSKWAKVLANRKKTLQKNEKENK
jgi:hypothetical protein